MVQDVNIISVEAEDLDQQGFFCYMSKRKAPGYRQKRDRLEARFAEGLKIKMIHEIGGRTVTLQTAEDLQHNSLSPYGVFGLVLNGRLLAYHYLLHKDFDKLVPPIKADEK